MSWRARCIEALSQPWCLSKLRPRASLRWFTASEAKLAVRLVDTRNAAVKEHQIKANNRTAANIVGLSQQAAELQAAVRSAKSVMGCAKVQSI